MILLCNYKTSIQETPVRKINVDFELVVYPKLVKNSTFIKLKGVLIFLVPFTEVVVVFSTSLFHKQICKL